MASEEQQSLLSEMYRGEKEPESKDVQERENVVEGVPLGPGNGVGSTVSRTRWNSSLFACLGSNDEFCSSDLEVCVLGTFAPCILYASNVERLNPTENNFGNHCLSYTGLLFLGKLLIGCNALAPCFSYSSRSDVRRKYNLEGHGECFAKSCGCCTGLMENEDSRERCESVFDFGAHFLCHRCALCQEGRELRRRMPHPGFFKPYMAMVPPVEQVMTSPM